MSASTIISGIAAAIACISLYVSWRTAREQKSGQREMRVHELRLSVVELLGRIESLHDKFGEEDLDLEDGMLGPKDVTKALKDWDEILRSRRNKSSLPDLNDLDVILSRIRTRLDNYDFEEE